MKYALPLAAALLLALPAGAQTAPAASRGANTEAVTAKKTSTTPRCKEQSKETACLGGNQGGSFRQDGAANAKAVETNRGMAKAGAERGAK